MRKLSILFFVVFALSAFSQNHYLGVKAGFGLTNVSEPNIFAEEVKMQAAFMGGLSYEYLIKKHLLLGADLMYRQNGYSYKISITNSEGMVEGTGRLHNHTNYVSLPLKAGYLFGDRFSGFVNVGLVPAIILDAYYKLSDPNHVVNNPEDIRKISYKEYTNNFELSGLLEIGGNYRINNNFLLSTTLITQYGFTEVLKTTTFNVDMRNDGAYIVFGLKYNLTKN